MKKIVLLLLAVMCICACDDVPTYVDDDQITSSSSLIDESSSSEFRIFVSEHEPDPFMTTIDNKCKIDVKRVAKEHSIAWVDSSDYFGPKRDIPIVGNGTVSGELTLDVSSTTDPTELFCKDLATALEDDGFVHEMIRYCLEFSNSRCLRYIE